MVAEHCGWVDEIHNLYLQGRVIQIWAHTQTVISFVIFLGLPWQTYLKLSHNHSLPFPIHCFLPIIPSNAMLELLTALLSKLTHDAWFIPGALTSALCFSWYSVLWTNHINHTHFTVFTNMTYDLLVDITFTFSSSSKHKRGVPWRTLVTRRSLLFHTFTFATTQFSGLCRRYSSHHTFYLMLIFRSSYLDTFFLCMFSQDIFYLVFISQQFYVSNMCCTCNFHTPL